MQKQNLWDGFAQQDPLHYIDTSRADYESQQTGDEARATFFSKGQTFAAQIVQQTAPWRKQQRVAIEIGPGVGRLTVPMSQQFDVVRAVDVSPTMLGMLQENCQKRGITNVETYLPHEDWDKGDSADLVYSWQVFRHIEDYSIIQNYVRRIGSIMDPQGAGYLMFETRPQTLAYHVRNAMPDAVLPRDWRRAIRGIRRTPEQLLQLFSEAGMKKVDEKQAVSRKHIYVLTPQ